MNLREPKKKIVWQAHEANQSGANIALLEYVFCLQDVYDFHIILPHIGNMTAILKERKISFSVIHQNNWAQKFVWWDLINFFRISLRSYLAIRQIKKLLIREKSDIVFTNTQVPFTAAVAANRLNIPHVWWIHEFGEEDFGFKIGWGNQKWAYKKMQQWSQLIVYNSFAVANKFKLYIPSVKFCSIYQPVTWHGNIYCEKKIAKFLIFGQITPSKGQKEVLLAMAANKKNNLPSNRLHIKGPCENQTYLEELNQIIRDNNLQESVQIETGFFNKAEIMPMYEVLIVPSRSEAFGRVIVEANKAGLKVLVKNCGGAPELVNETNGLLYNTEDELKSILSGQKELIEGPCCLNYSESEEIEKIKDILNKIS